MTVNKTNIRVAVAQFHVGVGIDRNLQTCLRMLDKAAECEPDLIVLPEFCNHLSWYDNKQHCFDVSVTLDGPFLAAIAARAKALACYVVVNCTVQRADGKATGSSLLYSSAGELLHDNTKQIYIGHENDFLEKAKTPGKVIATPIGRIGLYACMDGVINETPRCLGLDGAQMIVNSLNSFATDEGSLHVPVRAGENKVFVVAANKIGPLVPEALVEPISSATGIPPKFLDGAGDSQVVAPDGTVLVMASHDQEAVVFADVDLSQADNKGRPDGTDVFECRRPELYQAIGQNPDTQILPDMEGSASMRGAVVQLQNPTALDEAVKKARQAISEGAQLVVVPPLFGEGKLASIEDPRSAALTSADTIAALQEVCGDAYLATAAVLPCADGYQYCSVIIGRDGLVLSQPQIHRSERYRWSQRCSNIVTANLPFGRVAAVCSDDSFYPEYFRLLAMAGVSVATVPLAPLEKWELQTGLLERSAENRINLLVAAQPSSLGASFSTALQTDFTVMTEWQERRFDGLLSQPICNRADPAPGVYHSTLYPANAANKVVSLNTDLLTNRPWELSQAITRLS